MSKSAPNPFGIEPDHYCPNCNGLCWQIGSTWRCLVCRTKYNSASFAGCPSEQQVIERAKFIKLRNLAAIRNGVEVRSARV